MIRAGAYGRWDPCTGLVCSISGCFRRVMREECMIGGGRMRAEASADSSYDASSAVGLVRAAERARSPAILQLFPISLEYGGVAYLRYCVEL